MVESSDGVKLKTRLFKPNDDGEINQQDLAIVLVHPYSVLGGCQGLLKGIASGLAAKGYKAVTFDMRGVGSSTGRPSLTGFAEIKDVIGVCKWVCQNLSVHRILLVGSSAGMIFFPLFDFFCLLIYGMLCFLVIVMLKICGVCLDCGTYWCFSFLLAYVSIS